MNEMPRIVEHGYAHQSIIYPHDYTNPKNLWDILKQLFRWLITFIEWLLGKLRYERLKNEINPMDYDNQLISSTDGMATQFLIASPYRYFRSPCNTYDQRVIRLYHQVYREVLTYINAENSKVFILAIEATQKYIEDILGAPTPNPLAVTNTKNYEFITVDKSYYNLFSIWIQDPIIAGKNVLPFIEAVNIKRYLDFDVAKIAEEHSLKMYPNNHLLPIQMGQLPPQLYCEGGNILVGDDFWLIGINDLGQTAYNYGIPFKTQDDADKFKELYKTFDRNREIIVVQGTFPTQVHKSAKIKFKMPDCSVEWKDHVYRGNSLNHYNFQPLFHLDMFITPTGMRDKNGKYIIYVGSPKAAFDYLKDVYPGKGNDDLINTVKKQIEELSLSKQREKEVLEAFNEILNNSMPSTNQMEIIIDAIRLPFLNLGVPAVNILRIQEQFKFYQMMQNNINNIRSSKWEYAQDDSFNVVADSFDKNKFAVHRLPLPLLYEDNSKDRERSWYFATYNNVIFPNNKPKANTKVVLSPSYGYDQWEIVKYLDRKVKQMWEDIGVECNLLPNFQPFANQLGAIHCMTKVLERKTRINMI